MNQNGIRFIHEKSRPLDVDTMDKATEAIVNELMKAKEAFGNDLKIDEFARHLAWVIGFDTLIDDRKAIRAFTDKIVEAS